MNEWGIPSVLKSSRRKNRLRGSVRLKGQKTLFVRCKSSDLKILQKLVKSPIFLVCQDIVVPTPVYSLVVLYGFIILVLLRKY